MQRFSIPQLVDLFPSILAPVNWKTYIVLLDDNTTYDLYTRRKNGDFFKGGRAKKKKCKIRAKTIAIWNRKRQKRKKREGKEKRRDKI